MSFRRLNILWLVPWVFLSGCGSGAALDSVGPALDLEALQERGTLRVVIPGNRMGEPALPRRGSPVGHQREWTELFAESLGLELEWVPIFRLGDMVPALQKGEADFIAANLTVTPARSEWLNFTQPIDHVHEVLLVAAGREDIRGPADLEGKTVMVDPASAFWESLSRLRDEYPLIRLLPKPSRLEDETLLDLIVAGRVDATVRDSNVAEMYLSYREDIQIGFALGERKPIAWAVRKDAPQLLEALNQFLSTQKLVRPQEPLFTGDLAEIRERRRLRIILPNTAASYFLWRGNLVGFEYEYAQHFAQEQGLRLEVVVPSHPSMALQWLEEGRADIAGGFLEWLETAQDAPVTYTRPWHHAQPTVLGRANALAPQSWDALSGTRIAGSPNCSAWFFLQDKANLFDLELVAVNGLSADSESLVNDLLGGEFDYVVMEHHLAAIELARRDDIQQLFPVGDPLPQAWAVRVSNEELLAALNEFFRKQHRGELHNILYRRYFQDQRRIRWQQLEVSQKAGQLSDWDAVIQEVSADYDFDWRLIAALMYHESRFDPEAKSPMGAQGLMQIMPRAAEQVGISDISTPENNIRAGIKYLNWVRERFSEDLPFVERVWFALAAYNAGAGHVFDARRLAEQKGWDPDRWFDHVERAMLLLSQREYYSQARHGYVRGSEPVAYVRNIRDRYRAYVLILEGSVPQPAT